MNSIGLDVHKVQTQFCMIDEFGEITEKRFRTTRESLEKVFLSMEGCRVLLEASTESEWVAQCIESMGHEVIVADPNFVAMYGERNRKVKTDRRDARSLALACAASNYRVAHRLSWQQRQVRSTLHIRTTLVRTRSKCICVVRSLLRRDGYRVTLGAVKTFVQRVQALNVPGPLAGQLEPMFLTLSLLNEQIAICDRQLMSWVAESEDLRRLCTAPCVGVVTAVTFVSIIDTPERFAGPHQAEAYLGLVPSEWSSGERRRRGGLTKAGNRQMRSLLVEAGWRVLRSKNPEAQPLRQWAERISARRGRKVAVSALARKLAGVLFAMWRDGCDYDPGLLMPRAEVTEG